MASKGAEALDRILRYIYTGRWRDELSPGASATIDHLLAPNPAKPWLEGLAASGRRFWDPRKFEANAAHLRAYLCENVDDVRSAHELAPDRDDFDIGKVLMDRVDRNDFPNEERFLVVLVCCVHWSQPVQAVKRVLPAVQRFCSNARRLFNFVYYRLVLGGRETSATKELHLARSDLVDVEVEGLSSSCHCWTNWLKKLVAGFYTGKETKEQFWRLLSDVTAHGRGNGWTHADLLKMAHVRGKSDEERLLLTFLVRGIDGCRESDLARDSAASPEVKKVMNYLEAVNTLNSLTVKDASRARALIEEHDLTWDHVPSWFHRDPVVWEALVAKVPLHFLWTRLRALSVQGVIAATPGSRGGGKASAAASAAALAARDGLVNVIAERFANPDEMSLFFGAKDAKTGEAWAVKHRVHPLTAYLAHKLYKDPDEELNAKTRSVKKASGVRKPLPKMPPPNPKIEAAMSMILAESFEKLPATNLNWLLVVDRSPLTLSSRVNYLETLKVKDAMAVMVSSFLRTEPAGNVDLAGMTQEGVRPLDGFSRQMSPEETLAIFSKHERTGRVSVVEILDFATKSGKAYDAIVVMSCDIGFTLTARTGKSLVSAFSFEQEMDEYVSVKKKPNFKLIVCGLSSRVVKYTLKKDPRVLYVRGMDHEAPWIMRAFAQNSF